MLFRSYGPRTQAYGETNYLKEKLQVLDRTKALYGPRTQAYGETNYLKEKLQVLDRTKALYGPRTQAYGKTNYLREITSFRHNPGLHPMERLSPKPNGIPGLSSDLQFQGN